jgi:hypothetical protein
MLRSRGQVFYTVIFLRNSNAQHAIFRNTQGNCIEKHLKNQNWRFMNVQNGNTEFSFFVQRIRSDPDGKLGRDTPGGGQAAF